MGLPAEVETGRGPPMAIPLGHFLVALVALVASGAVGLAASLDAAPGMATVAVRHLLLAGWVCLTIMGAMTQFVPVWSGVELHSRRLATAQLWLVAGGLAGFAAALLAGRAALLAPFGAAMLAGFWTFVYNLARTLPADPDPTERHFAAALAFFVLATGLGLLLATSSHAPLFARVGLARPDAVAAHATLAVFGAVLTTVAGALTQLGTMFTGTDLDGVDLALVRAETVAYPVGVLTLAGGRLVDSPAVARAGGVLVVLGLCVVAAVLGRKLVANRTGWTPVLSRYAVFVAATATWAAVTLPAWLARPTGPGTLLGGPGGAPLLAVGAVGFVVAGTLYHVVPFLVWLDRYSDRLGLEDVPMVEDLYDSRLARLDLCCLLVALVGLVAAEFAGVADAAPLAVAGSVAFLVGASVFAANLGLVVREHGPRSLAASVLAAPRNDPDTTE